MHLNMNLQNLNDSVRTLGWGRVGKDEGKAKAMDQGKVYSPVLGILQLEDNHLALAYRIVHNINRNKHKCQKKTVTI